MLSKQDQRIIKVVPYDASWPIQFRQEAKKIKIALGDNCIEIHHIGSTAVLDLAAKPIIDILPIVLDITKVDGSNASMLSLGYVAKGEYGIPFRRYFQKGGHQRTHQVHVFEQGNPEIEHYLKFRDWMRTHPEDRDAYADLKQDLARQHPHDITAYCLGKDSFIATIDKKTGFSALKFNPSQNEKNFSCSFNGFIRPYNLATSNDN